MVTTFNKIVDCGSSLDDIAFDLILCDCKNFWGDKSMRFTIFQKEWKCTRRIVMTNADIENDLNQYYTIFNFTNPNVLGTYENFNENYKIPINQGEEENAPPELQSNGEKCKKELLDKTRKFYLCRTPLSQEQQK
jgi:DNA repair and recombination RAD54-like protein